MPLLGKRIAVLASGTVAGQAVLLLASPILTRLYDPEAFGVLGIFVALVSIMGVTSALRYPLAIPLPDNDKDAATVLRLSLLSVVLTFMIFLFLTWSLKDWLAASFGLGQVLDFLWLLPLVVAISGTYDAFNYWAIRVKGFAAIARTRLSQGLATALSQLILGFLGLGQLGLLVGQGMGRATGLLTLIQLARRTAPIQSWNRRLREIAIAARTYSHFPLFSTWSAFANTVSAHLPLMVLTLYFGTAVGGLYTLSLRVLQTPVMIIGTAVSQVFLSDAASAYRAGTLPADTLSVLRALARVSFPIGIVATLTAPAAFDIFFGPQWRLAGAYTQLLVPWLLLVFLTSPLSVIPSVLGHQRGELVFNVLLLLARLGALIVGGLTENAMVSIAAFGVVSATGFAWYLAWIMRIIGLPSRQALRALASELRPTILIGLCLALLLAVPAGWTRDTALLVGGLTYLCWVGVRLYSNASRSATRG